MEGVVRALGGTVPRRFFEVFVLEECVGRDLGAGGRDFAEGVWGVGGFWWAFGFVWVFLIGKDCSGCSWMI